MLVDLSLCDIGGKLKDSNNNVLIDECLNDINVLGKLVVGIEADSENYKFYVNYKDKTLQDEYYYIVNDYVVETNESNTKFIDYNQDGDIKEYYDLIELDNGYIGIDSDGNSYFLNKELNKISGSYKSIYCNMNNFCAVENNSGSKALYYLNDRITEFDYLKIEVNDDLIVLDNLAEKVIVRLEKGNSNRKLSNIKHAYANINVNEIIKKYNLNFKELIKENKDFFQQFSYIVENNNELGDYRKYLYDIFTVVIDNYEYLNKPYFMEKLSTLKIKVNNSIGDSGLYYNSDNLIELFEADDETTIYHELMHFLDFSFQSDQDISLWNCDNKIVDIKEYNKLNLDKQEKCESINIGDYHADYLVEGGAELMTAKHLTKGINSYFDITSFLTGIEYIFGSSKFNELFFGSSSDYKII